MRRLLVRELQRGKLAGFIGIGGGLKALRVEQSLTGKGFTQVWMQLTYCLISNLCYPSTFLVDIWMFVGLFGVDDEGHLLLVDI